MNDARVDIAEEPVPIIYTALGQFYQEAVQVQVRTAGDPTVALNPIMSTVREMDGDLRPVDTPEAVCARARTIRAAAERASGITRQLLRFARQDVDPESAADLNSIVTECAHLLEPGFAEGLSFEMALAKDAPTVSGDATSLQQVFVNLVLNARDACGERGTVRLRTGRKTVLRAEHGLRPGVYGVVSVEDDGEGMHPAQLERIFDPFFTTKASGVGTGLGLSVVYAIVTGLGGHVQVNSEPGRGTCFDVFLPQPDDAPAET